MASFVALEAVPSSQVADQIVVVVAALEVARQSTAIKVEVLQIVIGVAATSFIKVESGDQKLEAM